MSNSPSSNPCCVASDRQIARLIEALSFAEDRARVATTRINNLAAALAVEVSPDTLQRIVAHADRLGVAALLAANVKEDGHG